MNIDSLLNVIRAYDEWHHKSPEMVNSLCMQVQG